MHASSPAVRPRPCRASVVRSCGPSLIAALALIAVFGLTGVAAEEEPAPLVLAAAPTATPPVVELIGDRESPTLAVEEATSEPDAPEDQPVPPAEDEPAVEEIVAVQEVLSDPGDDDITVEMRVSLCPTDVTAIADDIAVLTAACPEPGALLTPLLNQEGLTTPGMTDASAAASWTDRALGTAHLALNLPPESGVPIAFCRDDLPGSDWVRYTVGGDLDQASIVAELTVPGAWFICSWYVPPAPRSLTIQAWTCPVEMVASHENEADFFDACTDPVDGLGFRLDTGSGVAVTLDLGDGHAPLGATTGEAPQPSTLPPAIRPGASPSCDARSGGGGQLPSMLSVKGVRRCP